MAAVIQTYLKICSSNLYQQLNIKFIRLFKPANSNFSYYSVQLNNVMLPTLPDSCFIRKYFSNKLHSLVYTDDFIYLRKENKLLIFMISKEARVDQVVLQDFSADCPDFWVNFCKHILL